MDPVSESTLSPVETVAGLLEEYARRGVFRGFSRGRDQGGKATFRMMWHRDRFYDFILDVQKQTMRFPLVLPNVPNNSSMHKEFKEFLKSRHSEDLPEHRRIDRQRAEVRPYNRGGNLSLSLKVKDGDYEYGARKFIHLIHEIFMVFLYDGRYYEYMIENFDLDPDTM